MNLRLLILALCPALVALPAALASASPDAEVDAAQRRAIRGCPTDIDCRPEEVSELDEIVMPVPKMPADGESPWIDAPRTAAASVAQTTSPASLRPDLPWLDELVMPDLPIHWDDRIIEYLEFYRDEKRGQSIMRGWLRAQGVFRDMIVDELRRAGLPLDLLYVAMIESSYDPYEYSRAGASGLWQFMPSGAKIYGLRVNRWLDERNDPVKSTEAAMMYFEDLYQRFGQWDLALAAYNAGYAGVIRSVARYNTNDFWQLLEYENALPYESEIYVPKALAAAIVGNNVALFGFDGVEARDPFVFDTVMVPKSVELSIVARAAGVKTKAIEKLNPQLLRDRTPPGQYDIRVPKGTAKLFNERFGQLKAKWDDYDEYEVPFGERFEDVATTYGLSRKELRELNGVVHDSEVTGGFVLLVPKVSDEDKAANARRADADLYRAGVPKGVGDEPLIVAVPDKDFALDGLERVFYRVVSGDNQYRVARAFGVDRMDLAAWNGLDSDAHLQARMVLQVFVEPDAELKKVALLDDARLHVVTRGSEEHLDLVEERTGRKRVVYTAKKRISLAKVGTRYGLTHRDLARINRISHTTVLNKGDTIVVYEVVDPKRSKRAKKQAKKAKAAKAKKKKAKAKKAKAKAKTKKAKAKKAKAKKAKQKTTTGSEPETKTKTKAKSGSGSEPETEQQPAD